MEIVDEIKIWGGGEIERWRESRERESENLLHKTNVKLQENAVRINMHQLHFFTFVDPPLLPIPFVSHSLPAQLHFPTEKHTCRLVNLSCGRVCMRRMNTSPVLLPTFPPQGCLLWIMETPNRPMIYCLYCPAVSQTNLRRLIKHFLGNFISERKCRPLAFMSV